MLRVGVAGPSAVGGSSIPYGHPLQKLTVLPSAPMVQELMRRLHEASIEASCATERSIAEIYVGSAPSVAIWIANAEDVDRARQVLREVQAQRTNIRCPSCHYELRGHAGATTCPECGESMTASAPDVTCSHCGECVPADFEICWNCGGDLGAPEQRDA